MSMSRSCTDEIYCSFSARCTDYIKSEMFDA